MNSKELKASKEISSFVSSSGGVPLHIYLSNLSKTTLETLGLELGVSATTLHNWKELTHAPSVVNASQLIEFSRGVLSWESIYAPMAIAERLRSKN